MYVDDKYDQSLLHLLGPPKVKNIKHNSFQIHWSNGKQYSRKRDDIRYYNVELSQGRKGSGLEGGSCSDDYKVVDFIQVGNEFELSSHIGELSSDTPYCARIIAVGDSGIHDRSASITINTLPTPHNTWWPSDPRDNLELLREINDSESPSCKTPDYPTPRRGHSMSFVNNRVYLFGGLTDICICKGQDNMNCGIETVYSNEVWALNPWTNVWKRLKEHSWDTSSVPKGREQHSATVLPNGKVIIIGGKSDTSTAFIAKGKPSILGDVWEMNPGQITTKTFLASGSAREKNLPLEMENGHVSYHSQIVQGISEQEQCITDLSVQVSFFHPCIETLGFITLYGPKSANSSIHPSRFSGNDSKVILGDYLMYAIQTFHLNLSILSKLQAIC